MYDAADKTNSLVPANSLSVSGNENVNTHTFEYFVNEYKIRLERFDQAAETYYDHLNDVSALILEAEKVLKPQRKWTQWKKTCGIKNFYRRRKIAHSPRIDELVRLGILPNAPATQHEITLLAENIYRAALSSGKLSRTTPFDEVRAMNGKGSANKPKKQRNTDDGIGSASQAGAGKKRNGDNFRQPAKPQPDPEPEIDTSIAKEPVSYSLALPDPVESDDSATAPEPFVVDPELENELPEICIRVSEKFEAKYPRTTAKLFAATEGFLARDFPGFTAPTVIHLEFIDADSMPERKPVSSAKSTTQKKTKAA